MNGSLLMKSPKLCELRFDPYADGSRKVNLESSANNLEDVFLYTKNLQSSKSIHMKTQSDTPKTDPSPKNDIQIQGNILDLAKKLTHGDRNDDYGPPHEDMRKVSELVNTILGTNLAPHDIPTIMICIKLARESHVHKRDNLTDIAGWTWVKDECHKEEDAIDERIKYIRSSLEKAKEQGCDDVVSLIENCVEAPTEPEVVESNYPDASIDPGEDHYLLKYGTTLRADDEYYDAKSDTWHTDQGVEGEKLTHGGLPFRRAMHKFRVDVFGADDFEPDARTGALQKGHDEDTYRILGPTEVIQEGDELKPAAGAIWEPCKQSVGYPVEQFVNTLVRRKKGVPAEYILLHENDILWPGDEKSRKGVRFDGWEDVGSWAGQPAGASAFYFRRKATKFTEEDPEYGLPSGCPMPVIDPDPKVEIPKQVPGVSPDFPNGSIILKGEELLKEGDCVRQLGEKTWTVAPAAWHGFPCSNYSNMVFRRPLHVDEARQIDGHNNL